MKEVDCEACRALGIKNKGNCFDIIYHADGENDNIRLCYSHSVELFRYGQTFFVGKYKPDVKDSAGVKNRDRLSNYFIFNSER